MPAFTANEWERQAEDHEVNWRAWTRGLSHADILEIGSYEGRSALLWLDILPNAHITCVDPFTGTAHGEKYEALFDANTKYEQADRRIVKVRARSDDYWSTRAWGFNVVYIDGDHTAAAVTRDAWNAWRLLEPGGVMIFDDYEWQPDAGPDQTPRAAVDAFIQAHARELVVLEPVNGDTWQKAIRKL